ncbi:MAG: ribonuclease P protein component [Patescibacteria group bacterium]
MLPKINRVDRKQIQQIFKFGSIIHSPNLTFRYLKDKNIKNYKISFIVPKTVSKSAVQRNSLRRRGYIALEKNIHLLSFPIIGVFIFKKQNIENLENEIKNIIKKI